VSLRLLSYNIRFGGVGREQSLADVIKRVAPDLVVFQEATHPAGDRTSCCRDRIPILGPRVAITRSVS
jgi:endonuclease/exonuclease/phosphatase family metal-dependent hydrolase